MVICRSAHGTELTISLLVFIGQSMANVFGFENESYCYKYCLIVHTGASLRLLEWQSIMDIAWKVINHLNC